MPVNIKDDGSFEIIYGGPYKGIDVQMPQNLVDPAEATTSNNWLLRNATLQSRPRFIPWTGDLGGTNQLTGVGTFLSPAGFYHTFATDDVGNLYNLNGTTNDLEFVANLSHLTGTNPLQWRVINSTNTAQSALYMVNGAQTVCSWDGTIGPLGGGAIITIHLVSGGTGYAVNDTGTLTAGGANATYIVNSVSLGGVVTGYTITSAGTGYFVGSSATATGGAQPGVGVGFIVWVDSVVGGGPQQDVVQTNAGGVLTATINMAGVNYAIGDFGTITGGTQLATYEVLAVAGGTITLFKLTSPGAGYSTGVGVATTATTGIGTGFTVDITKVGSTAIGAKYIGTLAQHAILANTVGIAGTDGPFTIRWSAVGLPLVFDPAVNINAGFNIEIDFADAITGMMFLGRVAYIFHRTGITEMSPTGVGTAPFDFNHIWNAQDGTGSIYPYTISQYGQFGAFVSTENIYMVQNYQFQPIGGQSRDAIYADIHASLQQIGSNQIMGTIAPAYNDNYIYTVYQIYIPLAVGGPTAVWQYSIEGSYWERYILTGEQVTGIPTFCLVH